MLEFSFEGNTELQNRLQLILQRAGTIEPLLREIGEDLTEDTKKRFETATDPDGNPWLLNTPATLLAEDKFGNLRKKGDKPLTNEGNLAASIAYQVGEGSVAIGSNADQAAMMQFGGTRAEFPHLWGDIPARPFLGITDADVRHVLQLSEHYLLRD